LIKSNNDFEHKKWIRPVSFSPDGKMVLTGSGDGTAQLWDVPSARPLGPPLHQDWVTSAVFSPDGRTILTGSTDKTARLWRVPAPVEGDVARIVLWTQTITGMELDAGVGIHARDAPTWQERRGALDKAGGPPVR
jgi:hypothetical protein